MLFKFSALASVLESPPEEIPLVEIQNGASVVQALLRRYPDIIRVPEPPRPLGYQEALGRTVPLLDDLFTSENEDNESPETPVESEQEDEDVYEIDESTDSNNKKQENADVIVVPDDEEQEKYEFIEEAISKNVEEFLNQLDLTQVVRCDVPKKWKEQSDKFKFVRVYYLGTNGTKHIYLLGDSTNGYVVAVSNVQLPASETLLMKNSVAILIISFKTFNVAGYAIELSKEWKKYVENSVAKRPARLMTGDYGNPRNEAELESPQFVSLTVDFDVSWKGLNFLPSPIARRYVDKKKQPVFIVKHSNFDAFFVVRGESINYKPVDNNEPTKRFAELTNGLNITRDYPTAEIDRTRFITST